MEVPITDSEEDEMVWQGSANGVMYIKDAHEFYRVKETHVDWFKRLWIQVIPPKLSIFAWRVANNRIPLGDNLHRWNIVPAPICVQCIDGSVEDINHLLLLCPDSRSVWRWLSEIFDEDFMQLYHAVELLKWAAKQDLKNVVSQLRLVAMLYATWLLWCNRNKLIFELVVVNNQQVIYTLKRMISSVAFLIKDRKCTRRYNAFEIF